MKTSLLVRSFLAVLLAMGARPLFASGFPAPYPLAGGHAAFGDLNRDGKPDFVSVSFSSNKVSISLNRGDDTSFPPTTVTLTGVSNTTDTAFVADFNGDVNLDIAGGGTNLHGGSIIRVILGPGDGTFSAPKITSGCGPVVVGDSNGDGKLDVISCRGGVMFGKGNGTLGAVVGSSGASALAVADFNGDGRPDLVLRWQYRGRRVSEFALNWSRREPSVCR
jgi:hypothetical protein